MKMFPCTHTYQSGASRSWTGSLEFLNATDTCYEIRITGRGSAFHVILGESIYGDFLCIPSLDIGCSLAEWSDIFWNTENLSRIMNETDAVTIASALNACASYQFSGRGRGPGQSPG